MRVSFDFLTTPICLSGNRISVLYIENAALYRKTVQALYTGCENGCNIVFSKNFTPVNFKTSVSFLPDIFNLNFSSAFIKKVYADLADYAHNYLPEKLVNTRKEIVTLLEALAQSYDFDFDFNFDVDITQLLKTQDFKPVLNGENLAAQLLDFIIMTKKYTGVNCFVMLNLHACFTSDELLQIYKEAIYQNVQILLIENKNCYEKLQTETVYIVDEDMCEIIENK